VVVKTKQSGTLLDDLKEMFANLRRYRMKLNPEKCTFGTPAGQLLGYIVSQRGIEANPSKIKAIEALEPPTELRDVQKFAGCLASLSQLVSRLGEKAMPLYQLMKKTDHFVWSQHADDAFNDLKRALSMAPILVAPASREPMLLCIVATPRVISVVIVVEHAEEGKELLVQHPVYYLSEVLTLSKQNYPHYQKVAYGVYMAARKLKHYFKEHPITVVSTTPLSEIIGCKDAIGRVAKWAIELAAHTIQYKPRTTIKSQILANFFADWGENQYLPPAPDSTHWRMNFDGSKMHGVLGSSVVLISPKGDKLHYMLQIRFTALNNVTEYEALVHGLKMAKEIGIRRILCFGDSDLVVHQVSAEWDSKDANMASYRFYVQQLCGFFEGCEFHHIPRANNDEADQLSKIGSTRKAIPVGVSLEIIRKPSIRPSLESNSIFVLEDPAPAKAPLPNPRAAASEQEGAAGQPSVAGKMKDSGAAVSRPASAAGHLGEAGSSSNPGVLILWYPASSTSGRYHPGQSHSPTISSLGTCR
jgi:ribonuclease HI